MPTKPQLAGLGLAATMILVAPGMAFAQEHTEINGMIVGRDGPAMVIVTDAGRSTVVLTDTTRVLAVSGLFGLQKDEKPVTDLIPGLPVEVDAVHKGASLEAAKVTFSPKQLTTARQIEAGLHPTQQAVASNQQGIASNKTDILHNGAKIEENQIKHEELVDRFGKLGDYDVKGETKVMFAINSSVLTDDGKKALQAIAAQAKGFKGYLISVAGYADAQGAAKMNEKLSQERADAVITYLQQSCGVALYRVMAPDAMGEAHPAAANETKAGRTENRRVEVKILVNKGLHA
jgi:outer membrane protein OmpA-like peptidoglycan-associated protein